MEYALYLKTSAICWWWTCLFKCFSYLVVTTDGTCDGISQNIHFVLLH